MCGAIRRRVATMTTASSDAELDGKVWATTLDEVEKGWLEGPLSDAQLESKAGPNWVPNHRFGLRQGRKIRVIDDFSGSL
eukprot:2487057-Amphidinium_carterae.1